VSAQFAQFSLLRISCCRLTDVEKQLIPCKYASVEVGEFDGNSTILVLYNGMNIAVCVAFCILKNTISWHIFIPVVT
jgi:hypothetical protein